VAAWGARAFVTVPFFMDILADVTLVGLNRLVFGLLPATFLDGHAIASYSRALWTAVFGPTLAVFLLLVLLPTARQAPGRVLVVSVILLVLFAGLSVAIWAWFRRPERPPGPGAGCLAKTLKTISSTPRAARFEP
jgi:hypothetical protein